MLGAACVESVNGLHCGEKQNVPDGGGIGQEHDDPVDAETDAAGGWHSVFKCSDEVFINGHCLIVAFCFFLRLLFETRTLVDGVVQLAESVAILCAGNEKLKAFNDPGIIRFALCERRNLNGIINNKRGLDELALNKFIKGRKKNLADGRSFILNFEAEGLCFSIASAPSLHA